MRIHQELEKVTECPVCGWKNKRGTKGSLVKHAKMMKDQKHEDLLKYL